MSPYDPIAAWYAESLRSGSPVHAVAMPALLSLIGEAAGLSICDLACGTGIVSRLLALGGAHVTGIDLSLPLLEIARAEVPADAANIKYYHGDIRHLPNIANDSFDGVLCSLALMDIDDLAAIMSEAARIVRPDGWFVFTITHPCFQGPESRWTGKAGGTVKREVRGYFREGYWRSGKLDGVRGQVGAYHRTLSTYLNAVVRAGLSIEEMREPQPQDEVAARVPGYAEVPVVLAVRCCKSASGAVNGWTSKK